MNCAVSVVRLRAEKLRREALRVLGSDAAADAWLDTPLAALGGQAPKTQVHTLEELQAALALLEVR